MKPGFCPLFCLVVASLAGCDNDCDFKGTRCNGNVVEKCGGVDQQVGRDIEVFPCEGPNPICFSRDDEHAACIRSPATPCTPGSFPPRCEGDLILQCSDGVQHVQAVDCAKRNPPKTCGPHPEFVATCL